MNYKGGSVLYYLDQMLALARRGAIPEDVLLDFVIRGLPNRIANVITINCTVFLG
jgi:hypothetical protein